MNYENFYEELLPQQKTLKDALASLQKFSKTIGREAESGDLKSLVRDLRTMAETASTLSAVLDSMEKTAADFDSKAYFESGDFAEQMLSACQEKGVDVRGEFPIYEMFPYRVRIDTENQDVYVDRKKVQCMRPQNLVETVKAGQAKLNKAVFNASTFINELADAYELTLYKHQKRPESDIYLNNLYKVLAPMGRFRKDYDQQSFAFDLARLYISEVREAKNGKKLEFGPSRDNTKAIRILDKNGQEQFLATIRFYS